MYEIVSNLCQTGQSLVNQYFAASGKVTNKDKSVNIQHLMSSTMSSMNKDQTWQKQIVKNINDNNGNHNDDNDNEHDNGHQNEHENANENENENENANAVQNNQNASNSNGNNV